MEDRLCVCADLGGCGGANSVGKGSAKSIAPHSGLDLQYVCVGMGVAGFWGSGLGLGKGAPHNEGPISRNGPTHGPPQVGSGGWHVGGK